MHRREVKPSDKKPILPRPLFVRSHEARPNPDNWKWRLVLLLTGGKIEVAPRLPPRSIHAREVLVVRLGVEGALNTVEVKMPKVTELVEIDDLKLIAPDTFVAIDVDNPEDGSDEGSTTRLVGAVVGWRIEGAGHTLLVQERDGHVMDIPDYSIAKAYWAPMGYRP